MNTPAELFASALVAARKATTEDMHVSMPGRIESYDRAKQKADVQPLVNRVYEEGGKTLTKPYPVCTDVPVEFFGGGAYNLTFPVERGMTCRLQFCSSSIDKFLALGGAVTTKDPRRFTLSDAVCVMGLRDFAHALKSLPNDAWVMAAPSGKKILLGSVSATEKAILGDAFKTAHTTLVQAIATALLAVPTSGSAIAADVNTALTTFNNALWLASKVRVE